MNKNVLQIIIAGLLLVIAYFMYDNSSDETESTIRVDEPTITDTQPPNEVPEVDTDEPPVDNNEAEDSVSFSGVFMGFVDGKDEILGSFKYAVIDDSTEIIRVDMRSIVGYDITGLEEQLGIATNDRVIVRGYLEDGEFVATAITAE